MARSASEISIDLGDVVSAPFPERIKKRVGTVWLMPSVYSNLRCESRVRIHVFHGAKCVF